MKITDKATEKVFIMPKIESKYLNRAKKAELKVLYSIFMHNGNVSLQTVCDEIEESMETVMAAIAFWRCAGVIDEKDDNASESLTESEQTSCEKQEISEKQITHKAPDSYTLAEIASTRQRDSAFGSLVSYFEKISGHLYNSAEQGIVLYLYDTLGIDCEVIMGVAQYCASIGKNSVRYIEKTVLNITEQGVKTYAQLESYLAGQKKRNDFQDRVKKIIGASNRALSKAEIGHIDRWQKEFMCSDELVSLAYEKTVAKINKPQVSYMSKILESWYQKGLKTVSEVEDFFKNQSSEKSTQTSSDGRLDFNLDDIFEKPNLS